MDRFEKLMHFLGVTEQEALEIIECDKAIDRGADPFPLSAEQKQAEKKMRQADRKPTVYKLDNTNGKRSKKDDNVKAEIMRKLLDCFDEYNPQVINAEREFTFTYADRKFKIVLSAPRS